MANKPLALLSVSNKDGLLPFAQGLHDLGYQLVSTGGTASALQTAGLPVTQVSELTGFPEMLEGRVKTLHPVVHGGILADRSKPEHLAAIESRGIGRIDVVCINLYPFAATIAKADVTLEDAIENIDIGGPAMIRSAAKNHGGVTVIVNPEDYTIVLEEMRANGGSTTLATRQRLAVAAFTHTAQYDTLISGWLGANLLPTNAPSQELPPALSLSYNRAFTCRYGENPHQKAAFYTAQGVTEPCVGTAKQVHGRELSFNNIYDLNAALETVKEYSEESLAAAVIIKHANPCGAALGGSLAEAFSKARAGDPVSAFGGILAVSRNIDIAAAKEITGKNTFFEAIIAPSYDEDALELLTSKKSWSADLRLLVVGDLRGWRAKAAGTGLDLKRVTGGLLAQTPDHIVVDASTLKSVTNRVPSQDEVDELLFAWRAVRHVRSNAIVFSAGRQLVGVGAGQMNRVQSVRLAVNQAGELAKGAVLASDAFFPFPDGPEAAAQAGITAIIQPGGSKKDQETIDVCNKYNVAMVYTGIRHFLH